MKIRDSGMPEEATWESFFDPARTLAVLGFDDPNADVVDFGCGYGTFAIAAASLTLGIVHCYDIDPAMVAATLQRAAGHHLPNLRPEVRDFVASGTGLPPGCADYVMLFNVLHAEEPMTLLAETWRVLRPGGKVAVMHWNYDATTPRGPSLTIRPRPERIRAWLVAAGFSVPAAPSALPPYHYGFVARKPIASWSE